MIYSITRIKYWMCWIPYKKIFSNIFRSKPEMKGFDAKVINKNMKKMQQDTSKIKKDQDIRIV